ncbi:MAG: HPF/RaiA family ribosome-associated protein [Candidatus Sungbacteria bacterium]|uniref:HPF/RaiA family ribosome-associated protein n=1 Tax=Candidatus Sungiibacteriota bacterium TaxID=2750080 RepID=A0A931SAU8_9BACT|nr:HPF/RaiA family ribosome-associated protein [Candidatus Sungbacteria bacterium]
MNYQIRYTKVESSQSIRQYIETKLVDALQKLARAAGPHDPWQFTIEVGRETLHHRKGDVWFAEVTGTTTYGPVRVRSGGSDIHEAIDIAEEELKATFSKSKGRVFSRGLRAARRVKNMMRLSRLARFFRRGRVRDEGL